MDLHGGSVSLLCGYFPDVFAWFCDREITGFDKTAGHGIWGFVVFEADGQL